MRSLVLVICLSGMLRGSAANTAMSATSLNDCIANNGATTDESGNYGTNIPDGKLATSYQGRICLFLLFFSRYPNTLGNIGCASILFSPEKYYFFIWQPSRRGTKSVVESFREIQANYSLKCGISLFFDTVYWVIPCSILISNIWTNSAQKWRILPQWW